MRKLLLFTTGLVLVSAGSAEGRPAPATGTPATIQRLLACRSVTDSSQRLACYDRETTAMGQAIASKDLVLIDKARASAAKRSLFGFSVPDFGGLFGGGGDEIKQIEGTVSGVTQNAEGGWTMKLADGSVWTQTDDTPVALPPERGNKVVVRRGTMGAYFLRLNGQPGFKVRRVG